MKDPFPARGLVVIPMLKESVTLDAVMAVEALEEAGESGAFKRPSRVRLFEVAPDVTCYNRASERIEPPSPAVGGSLMGPVHISKTESEENDWLDYLEAEGIEVILVERPEDLDSLTSEEAPNIALLDMAVLGAAAVRDCVERCSRLRIPTIALVPRNLVSALDIRIELDDFVSSPPDANELLTRVKQVLWRNRSEEGDDIIRVADLVINPSTYEVTLRGRRVTLRFKEYELLRLLASNPGRVYTRDALLSTIWGYDYFGGTRTVDVHIRRLRSKIEDAEHPYIETIWNVGYRFRNVSGA